MFSPAEIEETRLNECPLGLIKPDRCFLAFLVVVYFFYFVYMCVCFVSRPRGHIHHLQQ